LGIDKPLKFSQPKEVTYQMMYELILNPKLEPILCCFLAAMSHAEATWSKASSALGNSARDLWLLKNVPPKSVEAEGEITKQLESLKDAVAKGGILGINPSLPWQQMISEFAKPKNPMARIPSNLERFSGNYLNIVLGGALFSIFVGHPKRTAVALALNGAVAFTPSTAFDAPTQQLHKFEKVAFLKRITPAWLHYACTLNVQGFIFLLAVLSRRGRIGMLLGNFLVLAHATFKTRTTGQLAVDKLEGMTAAAQEIIADQYE